VLVIARDLEYKVMPYPTMGDSARSVVQRVTPPGTSSLVPFKYRTLVLVLPTQTISETSLVKGRSEMSPELMLRSFHVVEDAPSANE